MERLSTLFYIVGVSLAIVFAGGIVNAQTTGARRVSMPQTAQPLVAPLNVQPAKKLPLDGANEFREAAVVPVPKATRLPKVVDATMASLPGVEVGITYYDFQTNGAMANRLTLLEDGLDKYVQLVWMTSKDSTRDLTTRIPGFAGNSRGTHYTFLEVSDPDNPGIGIEDWQKVESQRAGWPSLVQYSEGNIGTPSHTPIRFFVNAGVGDQPQLAKEITTPADSALWPRAAVGNDITHLIYNRTLPGRPTNQLNEVAYQRSTDGGFTWSPSISLNGPNSPAGNLNGGLGGDTYAVTARGNKVVVVYTEYGWRTLSFTSTDGGATWPADQARVVYAPVHTNLDSAFNEWGTFEVNTDTVPAPNGHVDVIIDNDGTTHYVIGVVASHLVRRDTLGTRQNIIYFDQDRASLSQFGMLYAAEGANQLYFMAPPCGSEWDGEGYPMNLRVYDGASRWPQLGVDAQNNLYCLYGSWKNGDVKSVLADTTGGNQQNEPDTLVTVDALNGHVWATYKPAGINIWSPPTDLTPEGVNCQYGTLCDVVANRRMYMAYSASPTPGDRVTNVETPADAAKVMMLAFDVSKLTPVNSVNEDRNPSGPTVVVSPNPASEYASVRVTSVTNANVVVSLVSTLGETIMTAVSPDMRSDWDVVISTRELPTGTYRVVVTQNGSKTVVPVVVVR